MADDLASLLQRATVGRPVEYNRLFRPSWFYFMDCDPFWLWCHYHGPPAERFDETTRFDTFRMSQGDEWEQRYVIRQFPQAYRIRSRWGLDALRETLEAMLRGESAIHGAAVWLLGEEVYGKADLLVRSDAAPSALGNFHYRVKEIKNSSTLKDYHKLQAATYAWIVGVLQGFCPESFDIVLGDGKGEHCVACESVVPKAKYLIGDWRAIRDGHRMVQPLAYDSTDSPWRRYANGLLTERSDVSLLPGVGPKTVVALRARGFQTLGDILALGPTDCERKFKCDDRYYHALAYQSGRPIFRPGEAARITRRPRLVYFDVEDICIFDGKFVRRPHTYMLSVATPEGSLETWTARGEDDEAHMWADFLDWLGDPSDVALYCWSGYEFGRLDQAVHDHPQQAARLLAAKVALIDLKEEIKGRPFFPVKSYSIKSVAPMCGFKWSQDDVDGLGAQLMYLDWLRTADESIIKRVEKYNREDVLAMLAVDRFISRLPTN